MRQKKVCILVRNDVSRDPRVNRQVRWLAEAGSYRMTVIGFGAKGIKLPGVDKTITFDLKARSIVEKFASAPGLFLCNTLATAAKMVYWSMPLIKEMYTAALDEDYDIIHANDWDTLPIAVRLAREKKNGIRVIYDAHEYATLEFEESLKFKLFYKKFRTVLESENIKFASKVITVSTLIAGRLASVYGVRPEVIMNCPDWEDAVVHEPEQRDIKLCHHGGYHPTRGIEELIKCMGLLSKKYSLHLMLICDKNTLSKLQKLARSTAPGRVFFHNPVKPAEIVKVINRYDIGIYSLKPVNFNSEAALPNKFFEFMMSGLCLCIGPTPEMNRVVKEYGCGVVARGYDAKALAETIRRLSTKDIIEYKKKALNAARILNSQVEGEKMVKIYKELLMQ